MFQVFIAAFCVKCQSIKTPRLPNNFYFLLFQVSLAVLTLRGNISRILYGKWRSRGPEPFRSQKCPLGGRCICSTVKFLLIFCFAVFKVFTTVFTFNATRFGLLYELPFSGKYYHFLTLLSKPFFEFFTESFRLNFLNQNHMGQVNPKNTAYSAGCFPLYPFPIFLITMVLYLSISILISSLK